MAEGRGATKPAEDLQIAFRRFSKGGLSRSGEIQRQVTRMKRNSFLLSEGSLLMLHGPTKSAGFYNGEKENDPRKRISAI